MLFPRQKATELIVETIAHGQFSLASETPARMTLVCFYRGLHCPICAMHLKELERLTPDFAERGVTTIAISSGNETRTREMGKKIAARDLRIGYGLSLTEAHKWGLYLSASRGKTSIGIEEPPLFSGPGVFLLKPDQSVYYRAVQSMPFVRPNFGELLQALDFAFKNDYPARGAYGSPMSVSPE
jgi:hypothetical protein